MLYKYALIAVGCEARRWKISEERGDSKVVSTTIDALLTVAMLKLRQGSTDNGGALRLKLKFETPGAAVSQGLEDLQASFKLDAK